ncbi:MAG TPA: hypothetical protein VFH37_02760 [Candidatus Saccharimonadales bacterium]|nr:hypothetical protein [Candidatus Saccharimonadales bacterium]
MSIEARIEDLEGEHLETYRCHDDNAFCYLDEHSSRLLVARPELGDSKGVIVHSIDDFVGDPADITIENLKEISVRETVIAEIMPWSRRTFDVHNYDGQELFLTIVSLPLIQLFPVREVELE